MRQFYVYILASNSRRLYVGITNDLRKRLFQHRNGEVRSTSRYRIDRLVHFETTTDALAAIAREKELKGWVRARKVQLIEESNPDWRDLAEGWA